MTSALTLRSKPKVADVRQWLTALGVLTAGNMTRAECEMKLRAYVPLLQERFPAAAFTQASLDYVAAQFRFFPAYGDVVNALSDHWRQSRPPPPALPPPAPEPERDPPTPEEVEAVHKLVEDCVATLRASALYAEQQSQRLDEAVEWKPRARHLTPEQLDEINPLPNGRKRA